MRLLKWGTSSVSPRHSLFRLFLVDRITNSGSTPHGIWPSPDNTRVYVVLENSDAVDVIDTATRKVIATLRIGQEPQALVYVANAVPNGDGMANLTQQGLNKQVLNQKVDVPGGVGTVAATVRQVQGLDMINVRGRELPANTTFTVYATMGNTAVPLADLTSDATGTGEALAFTKFFGTFEHIVLRSAQGGIPLSATPVSGNSQRQRKKHHRRHP